MQDSRLHQSWADFFRHLGVEGTAVEHAEGELPLQCAGRWSSSPSGVLGDLRRRRRSPPGHPGRSTQVELFRFTDARSLRVAFLAEALTELLREEPLASAWRVLTPDAIVLPAPGSMGLQSRVRCRACAAWSRTTSSRFAPGVEVTEVAQVKGLEFDYVILVEANASHFPDEPAARRLLHVGATRAVHQLWITSVGTPSPILREALAEQG